MDREPARPGEPARPDRPDGAGGPDRPDEGGTWSAAPEGRPSRSATGWEGLVGDLARRRDAARAMGGTERLERQRAGGRLDARARVRSLLDPGSFVEIGTLVGSVTRGVTPAAPADALVGGHGLVEGRPVVVGAEDFTVMGGSIGLGTHSKRYRLVQLALQERVPLVMLLDGAGDRPQNAFERRGREPNDLQALVEASGRIPLVAVVMGPSAGHGALAAPLMDHVIMVEGACLFTAGPPLVEAATGEKVGKEELGGTAVHTALSGVAHDAAPDDRSALERVRRYLSYFPANAWEHPPVVVPGAAADDTGRREVGSLADVIPADPRRGYDVRRVIEVLADGGSTMELHAAYGRAVVVALARLGGEPVAVVANQPSVRAGAVDADAAVKAAHFVEVAGSFHLPVLFLADNPGVLAGTAAERQGVLRAAARLFAAQARHPGPKLHVTLRKAYGFGSSLMAMNPFGGQTVTLALPGARLGAMPAESGADAARLDAGEAELLRHAELGGAYGAADTLAYDEVVGPRELRNALLDGLRLASRRRSSPVEPWGVAGVRP